LSAPQRQRGKIGTQKIGRFGFARTPQDDPLPDFRPMINFEHPDREAMT
jgi:hypothetical protein